MRIFILRMICDAMEWLMVRYMRLAVCIYSPVIQYNERSKL
jgi:hypothetical protein